MLFQKALPWSNYVPLCEVPDTIQCIRKRRGPIQTFQNEGGLSKSSKWRKESDLQGLWICKYIESLLPAVQGNKSVLYLGPGHPDTEKRNKSLTDAHSAGLPMRHMAA